MQEPQEIEIVLVGPSTIEKSHLAELIQDVCMAVGCQVEPDPEHGFFTPAPARAYQKKDALMPIVRITEEEPYEEGAVQ